MRALFINTVCGYGSTGKICVELAKEYEAKGFECKIAYGRSDVPDSAKKYAVRIGSTKGTFIHALSSRIFDNAGFGSANDTAAFLKWADNYDPDLIWLHNLHGYYINVEMLFSWIKTRPHMKVKWTLHDCWAFTGHCTHFTITKCDQWKTECQKCGHKELYPKSYCMCNAKMNYKKKKLAFCGVNNMTIITPSKWLASLVKDSFLKDYPVIVVNNTIDKELFRWVKSDFRKRYGLEDKKIILGVASPLSNKKGLTDFVKLAELLPSDYVEVLVGVLDKEIRKLKKYANIVALPRTKNQQELVEIYSSSDVFVNPTHEDNYPTVNLEARACGLEVVTYDVSGSPESAGYKYVVRENDIDGLLSAILQICE